ncbi:non-ribosomal peptide synthetase [Streptomyces sp. EN16]|uniref:non-ribosomal peptide synthetase n=1 Tax=Streptomyces sp. EN16 TaxID=212773 RepID=UPI00099F5802|nr:non-ribosomal peptide synthetase [Streptomyces sp. EN16]
MGVSGGVPASAGQRRLRFLDQLRGPGTAYNVPFAVRLVGGLRVEVLTAALQDVVDRHPALRTQLVVEDGELRQRVLDGFTLGTRVVDGAPTRDDLARQAARPFELIGGPLIRAMVHRASPTEHVLAVTLHHAVTDGWSEAMLFTELAECYRARLRGVPPDLPTSGDYRTYAAGEASRTAAGDFGAGLAYWEHHLAHPPAPPRWPGTHEGDQPSDAGAVLRFALPEDLVTRLRAFALDSGTSVFMAGLVAFAVLVHRYTGAEDLVVGVPMANRGDSRWSHTYGLFVNTAALRVSLAGAPTLRTVLRRVRSAVLGALSFQDVPFDHVVARVAPGRDPVRVMCAMDQRAELCLPGVVGEFLDLPAESVAFDVLLSLLDHDDRISARLEYRTDLMDAGFAERVTGSFTTLLRALVSDPDQPIATVDVQDGPAREQWARFNDTGTPHVVEPLHRAVERVAGRTPDALAVVCGAVRWTYRELDQASHGYAALLRAAGVLPEDVVAVAAVHDGDLPARLLGVLRAGAAFLLLDPELPPARRALMVREAGCRLVLDTQQPPPAGRVPRPRVEVTGANAAYVTFTSGSTGTPKGVLVTHGAIGNTLAWFQRVYRLGAADRVLWSTAPGFDPSVWQLFWPLVAGAAVVLPDGPGRHRDPAELVALVRAHGVTVFDAVPVMLDLLLREPDWSACTSLRLLVSGGEALPVDLAERFVELGDATLVNHYGPAEAAIEAVTTHFEQGRHDGATVPIGRPLDNMRAHVLDAELMPVPPGVVGELYLGGPGLARGYVNRPDLTAERFVPDPFSRAAGARLYRTGDLVRLVDGELHYLGRVDRQLKLRGHRVEPGEVEAVLRGHPQVRAAVVRPHTDAAGHTVLVAYCVTAAGTAGLREWCARILPPAMCPSAVVPLPALPLGANGKVDIAALPAPIPSAAPDAARRPRTPAERLVARHWAHVLGRDTAARDEDFFAVGGHSLLAAALVMALRRESGGHVPLRWVFDFPVLADLAAALDRAPGSPGMSGAPPEVPGAVTAGRIPGENAPASPAQEQLWFLDQLHPGRPVYHAGFAVELPGAVDDAVLTAAFGDVVRRHEALRTRFPLHEGRPVARVGQSAPELVVCRVHDVAEALREHQRRPFDLANGPLVRACLLRSAGTTAVLAVSVHHIVFDEWSRTVFWRDLDLCYRARLHGQTPALPELPVRPADVALWQREHTEHGLEYWLGLLRDAPAVLDLPVDHPRPAERRCAGAVVTEVLPPALRTAARDLGVAEGGATLFMVLLSAWSVVLARHASSDDVLVGTVLGDRDRPELESLVGFYADTVVVRARLAGAPAFRTLLRQVRDGVLDAYAHRHVPFATVVERLRPHRTLSHPPLVQVLCELRTERPAELAGMPAPDVPWDRGTAKFDLALSAVDTGQEVRLELEYDRDLFTADTARRLLGGLRTALTAAAAAPGTPVDVLPLLTAAEQRALVEAAAGREQPAAEVAGVHELFERQARRTPDAVALVHGHDSLTYREVTVRANRLAHWLRAQGVGPGTVVALCCERGVPAYLAILAVLKAGGGYLPLDPGHPAPRLSAQLAQARPVLVLVHDGPDGFARDHGAYEVADLLALPGPADDPAPVVQGGDLACVLFTSGSTGRPKGVAMSHGALVSLMAWNAVEHPVRAGGGVLQYNSLCWDLSLTELFSAWQGGGRVVALGADRDRRDPQAVVDLLERHRVERWEISPTGLLSVVDWLGRTGRRPGLRLRTLIIGGERLQLTAELRAWLAALPEGCAVLNHYGPSEVNRCTEYRLTGAPAAWPALPPIGSPLPGTRVHILDPHGAPAPVGVAGEVFVGGSMLARGYLHQPGETARSFVPDPFRPGKRLYRTGDVARRRADGAIEFLRRADTQVKLRGYRIELGEVETVLRDHPDVREAVVLVVGDGPRDARLVAYLRPEHEAVPTRVLRAYLAARLPAHMVPADYVTVAGIPQLANGKIDRTALPAPAHGPSPVEDFVAPSTPTEHGLAAIYTRTLGIARVGVRDDFFALGGHSLLATVIVADVRAEFSRVVSVRDVFSLRTVAALAAAMDSGEVGAPLSDDPSVARRRSGNRS